MLFEPRMIGGALDREVEREFKTLRFSGGAQSAKCLDAAAIRMHRVVPALSAADRLRRDGIAECRLQSVVAALALRVTVGMDRRAISHVAPPPACRRQPRTYIGQRYLPSRPDAPRVGDKGV